MGYGFLADLVVVVHAAYVSVVVFGELAVLLGWAFRWEWVRNPWFRWTHLAMIAFVALETIVGISCFLTDWENALRRWAGQEVSEVSFIGRLLDNILFEQVPEWALASCYIGFTLLVLLTLWLVPPRRRAKGLGGITGGGFRR